MTNVIESKGYKYSVEKLNGFKRVTIEIPDGITPRGADCVTRSTVPGKLAICKVAVIDDDFNVAVSECMYEVTTTDKDKAEAELNRKHPGQKIKVQNIMEKDGETYGVPRDLFQAIAVHVTRPESQQKK